MPVKKFIRRLKMLKNKLNAERANEINRRLYLENVKSVIRNIKKDKNLGEVEKFEEIEREIKNIDDQTKRMRYWERDIEKEYSTQKAAKRLLQEASLEMAVGKDNKFFRSKFDKKPKN